MDNKEIYIELKDTEWKREYIDHEGMNTVLNNDKFR